MGVAAYVKNDWTLKRVQANAADENPRTSKLDDRTNDLITLNER